MSDDRKKFGKLTSPKGRAMFVFIDKPNTKFDADGVFQATVILDPAEPGVKEFLAQLDKFANEAYEHETAGMKPAQAKKVILSKPYSNDEDEEGNETGLVRVKAKTKALFRDKRTGNVVENHISVFDSSNPPKPIPTKGLVIGNGSIIRINFSVSSYYMAGTGKAGVSLGLNAVQVIKLESYGGSAESFGFDAEDGGYSAPDTNAAAGDDDDGDF